MSTIHCPCGSNKEFSSCCGAYISGFANPPTPEALMRSRYTAYTQANINYIAHTMGGAAVVGFNPIEAKQWAESVRWEKLEVLSSSMNRDKGEVKFKAFFLREESNTSSASIASLSGSMGGGSIQIA